MQNSGNPNWIAHPITTDLSSYDNPNHLPPHKTYENCNPIVVAALEYTIEPVPEFPSAAIPLAILFIAPAVTYAIAMKRG